MGTYHTFFVASEDALDRLFPGWKRVKTERARREGINPFTKEAVVTETWEPIEPEPRLRSPNFNDDVWGPALASLHVANDYMQGVEDAGPPGLRALPHFRAKNVDQIAWVEVGALAPLLVPDEATSPPARVGDPDDDDVPMVWSLSAPATAVLAALDDAAIDALAPAILEASLEGADGDVEEGLETLRHHLLRPLRALAAEAGRSSARLCQIFALHP